MVEWNTGGAPRRIVRGANPPDSVPVRRNPVRSIIGAAWNRAGEAGESEADRGHQASVVGLAPMYGAAVGIE